MHIHLVVTDANTFEKSTSKSNNYGQDLKQGRQRIYCPSHNGKDLKNSNNQIAVLQMHQINPKKNSLPENGQFVKVP